MGKRADIPPAQDAPEAVVPVDPPAFPCMWVYIGKLAAYGPYHGFSPESFAECLGLVGEGRQDFVNNLHPW